MEKSGLLESPDSQAQKEELAVDPCLPSSAESVLDLDNSMEVVKQQSDHSELSDDV